MSDRDVTMLFSGGLDSTLAAAQLLEAGAPRVHLLTFCNGFCVKVENSRVHVDELQSMYGADRVLHQITYVTDIFEELRRPLMNLIREYESTLVFDLCCRLSFETAALIYCVNNGVERVACGTNMDQGRLFLERPEYLEVVTDYFAEYGIEYFTPVYARMGGRQGRIDKLQERKISTGPRFLEKFNITNSLFQQPFCLVAIHTFFYTSFLRDVPGIGRISKRFNLSTEDAIRLRLDRQEIARKIIAERTAKASADDEVDGVKIQERFCTTRICGQNAVELTLPKNTRIDVEKLASIWAKGAKVYGGLLRAKRGKLQFEVFPDGRIVVTGTKNREDAVAAYESQVAINDVFSIADDDD